MAQDPSTAGPATMGGGSGDRLDVAFVRRALERGVVGRRVVYHDELPSTMDEAARLAAEGEPEGAVVLADSQTAGRGRFARAWLSEPGRDLSFSVVLRPSATQLPFMNMAAALAVAGGLSDVGGFPVTIKWPNDVRARGRKLAGILVETALERGEVLHAIVGIGINVNLDPTRVPQIASLATSVFRETGRPGDRGRLLVAVLRRLDDLYRRVRGGESLTSEWAARLETLGRTVTVRWNERVYRGVARSVDDTGSLVLSNADGTTTVVPAGEVTLQE